MGGNLPKMSAAYQLRAQPGQVPLMQLGVGPEQVIGYYHAENSVSQKLQLFVVLLFFRTDIPARVVIDQAAFRAASSTLVRERAVGHRSLEHRALLEDVAKRLFEL